MTDLIFFSGSESGNTASGGGSREEILSLDVANGEELTKELETIVERLKIIYSEQMKPITDDTIEVTRFCRCLETILRYGQREKISFWGEKKDYFHYLTEGLSGLKSLDQVVKKVHALNELVSGQGKGRALIRLCLSEQLLADCIQNSLSNTKKTKDWYQASSVLLTSAQRFISALYDLSNVTFELPVEGLDLDETWPSFVQKSFTKVNPSPDHFNRGSSGMSLLIKKALKTRDAKSINKEAKPQYTLERAVEEQPSEIFVKNDIPFDLALAGSLIDEIRLLLIDEFEGYSHLSKLPSIKVVTLDDITSALSLLKDYVSTMSSDVTKNNEKRTRLINQLKEQIVSLQAEAKESTEKIHELEEELEMKDNDLATSTHQLRISTEEKNKIWSQVLQQKEQITELTQELEEAKPIVESASQKVTKITQLSADLNSAHETLSSVNLMNSFLLSQLAQECETKSIINKSMSTIEELRSKEDKEMESQISELQEHLRSLNDQVQQKQVEINSKENQMREIEHLHSEELERLKEQLTVTVSHHEETVRERDLIKEEVKAMNGLVEQETASLRFQLSTANIQLQQFNENYAKKELQLVEAKEQLHQLSEQVGHIRNTLYQKDEDNQELQQQLAIADSRCQGLQDDVKSLNEQLTEKTLNRDEVREETLRLQRNWDDTRERMSKEMQRLNGQVSKLSEENEHLRKALQRLLEQKVNLWQHADELEQEQVAKGIWIDSRDVLHCMGCRMLFTMFNRKHHCRSCGKVFCGNCCNHKAQLPSNKDPVRVCKNCLIKIQSLRTPQASTLVNTPLDDLSTQQNGTAVGSAVDETQSINAFPGGVSLSTDNSFFLGGSDDDESLLQHLKELTHSQALNKKSPSDNNETQRSIEDSAEYSVEPLHKNLLEPVTYEMITTDATTIDPDNEYCIIDAFPKSELFPVGLDSSDNTHLDVHALRAKLAKLEETDETERDGLTNGRRRSSLDSNLKEADDLEVEGGKVHNVTIKVATPRTVVSWQFSSQPKGIATGLKYQETKDDETLVDVLPLKRVMSHKTVLTGEYVAQKAGFYTLVFSNVHSKYSGRSLSYKVWTKLP